MKWLDRIEVRETPFMGRFQARDYVTLREEEHDGKMVGIETSVGRALLKSAPAKVTRQGSQYRIIGAAWGAPIAKVEVQIDNGPWMPATIDRSEEADHAWRIWSLDWDRANTGRAPDQVTGGGLQGEYAARDGGSADCEQAYLLGEQRAGDTPDPGRLTSKVLLRSGLGDAVFPPLRPS